MTDELKTLKDMKCMGETHGFRPRWINKDDLKAEAVKWIKQNKFSVDREWIKHFFNLTDQDINAQEQTKPLDEPNSVNRVTEKKSVLIDAKRTKTAPDLNSEDLEEIVATCDWCGKELNKMHDDEMCKYLNR